MNIRFLLRSFFSKDEATAIVVLLILSFCMGIGLAFFFTVSISSFLVSFSGKTLPYAYLLAGGLSYVTWAAHRFLSKKLRFSTALIITLVLLFISIGVLAVLHVYYSSMWLSMILLAWVSPFLFIKNVCFWGLAARLFNIRQSKRIFGVISSGEVVSNIIGFLSVPFLLAVFNTTGLLIISVLGVLACIALVVFLVRRYGAAINRTQAVASPEAERQTTRTKDNFFLLVVIFCSLPVFVFYFVDYMFFSLAGDQFGSIESLASFMGYFLGAVSVLELIFKSVVFNRVLTYYGLRTGILCLYMALGMATILTLLVATLAAEPAILFSAVALSKLLERSLSNGIHVPSIQILYQPLPAAQRGAFQSNAEGISQALGNVAAGGTLLLLSALPGSGMLLFSGVLLVVLYMGFVVSKPLYKAYKRKLQETLTIKRSITPVRKIMSARDIFNRGLSSKNAAITATSHRLLSAIRSYESGNAEELLTWEVIAVSADANAISALERMFSKATPGMRLRMLELYARNANATFRKFLLDKMDYPSRSVQFAVIRVLYACQYTTTADERFVVKEKIGNVVQYITWLSASLLDLETSHETDYARDALVKSLRAERKEYFDALYMLLSFMYGYATVELIKNNLIDKSDTESHIFALEVVANTFDEDITLLVSPWFDNTSPDKSIERLALFYPQEKLSIMSRALAILYQDYAAVTLWTKANALHLLADFYTETDARSDIVAYLFHQEPLLHEVAFSILRRYAAVETEADFLLRNKVLRSVNPATDATLYEKVMVLHNVPLFHISPEHRLVSLAANLTFSIMPAGTHVVCHDQVIIILSGSIDFFRDDQLLVRAQSGFVFIHEIHPIRGADHGVIIDECAVLRGNKASVLAYLFEDSHLSKNLLKYASEDVGKHVYT